MDFLERFLFGEPWTWLDHILHLGANDLPVKCLVDVSFSSC